MPAAAQTADGAVQETEVEKVSQAEPGDDEAGDDEADDEIDAKDAEKGKSKKAKKRSNRQREKLVRQLPEPYLTWANEVQYLISPEELDLFLDLDKDYQRDAFIERFWKVRDPYPGTARNEFREDYGNRLRQAKESFGNGTYDDRTRVLLTNGFPLSRIPINCTLLWPAEVWYYDGSDTVGFEFLLLFYQRWGQGNYRVWELFDGLNDLSRDSTPISLADIQNGCRIRDAEALQAAIGFMRSQGQMGGSLLVGRITTPPELEAKEWIATFASYTTDVAEDAATFDATVQVSYPGRHQSRTVTQGNVVVETASIAPVSLGDGLSETYNLVLLGEVLRDGKLFDTFRYQYDFPARPADDVSSKVPLLFQRYLRPGTYDLIVRVEDLGSGAFYRHRQSLEVPRLEKVAPAVLDAETEAILQEANAAIRDGETTVKIAQLLGEWQTGLVRIDAMTTGTEADKVTFLLDSRPVLTKKNPPYNVELDLGDVPRPRVLRVEAYDSEGTELAADEIMLNAGDHRFAVRLEEPRRNKTYKRSLRAEADVIVPKGEVIERVEFYLNETKLSTLYQEPWVQPVVLPEEEPIAYVRAAAYLPDGAMAEDLVFINAPENLEEIDVDFVELYTLVLDKDSRPVQGLSEGDFTVREDGRTEEIVRFEQVENLPIHVAVLLDVSASMEERLGEAREAAVHFFRQTVTPKDRATAVVFNDHPKLTHDFTNDVESLASSLAGVKPERGTALYDALIYSLFYFNGVDGQRAILLLSDGRDESSRFDFDDVLEYAHRSAVSIYSIGLNLGRGGGGAKRQLEKLAEQTGGRSFFVDDTSQLRAIYDTIQQELRSRYLLAYQSSSQATGSAGQAFRTIEVEMTQQGLEAKTLRGYYP